MLVLSRKVGERIHIGNDVFIEVRRVAGNRVTLAISAPRSIRVLRGELLESAKSFQQPAADTQPEPTVQSEPTKSETYIVTHEHVASNEQYPESIS